MGNTPAKDKRENLYANLYSNYIQQQQDLIYKQQQQINSLYQFNLQSKQEMTPNMFFQSDIQQQQQLPQQQLPQLPPANKSRLDPYKILKISKEYDEKTLKKAYLKAAMITHPDRGGSQKDFQLVSIAFTLLKKKLKEKQNNHSHNDLKNMSKEYNQQQINQPKQNINMSENFDVDVFNKIYEENKIPEVFDQGYGSWMEENKNLNTQQQKMFQQGFNKDLFNHTFDKYKQEQKNQYNSQIVQYSEPEQRLSMKNQDSLAILGQDTINNFGGETDNLSYTDYKQAFTDGSTLIDIQSININDRSNSMQSIKTERSNLSYTMNPEDQRKYSIQKLEEENAEKKRIQRLQIYDQRNSQAYDKIHSLLLQQ
tara:strand:+ start:79 stop:1182 length:1104 start_codon:yes stop_codon:yes gene_type:complete